LWEDLVVRNGLKYEKFTDIPFGGEVKGKWQGVLKDGKFDGYWRAYRVMTESGV
jgi:hypothetical protein